MKTVAYVRVSTGKQDNENQRVEISRYADENGLEIVQWFQIEASSRKSQKERQIDVLIHELERGDTLIVSELSRLGRSLSQIVLLVNELLEMGVTFIAIKQGMKFNGKQDMATKVQVTMFALMAEIERDLISERTKMGLQKAREKGKLLGRPKGKSPSRLDPHGDEIRQMLADGATKTAIAKKYGVAIPTVTNWLKKSGSFSSS